MRPIFSWSVIFCGIISSSCTAQTAAPAQVHCSIQKPAVLTDADRAYVSGDFVHAESLFLAQLAATPTFSNYSGLVRTQLEENKLLEALATAHQAISSLPTSGDALSLLGDVQQRSGQIPESLMSYKNALKLDFCSAHAHMGYATLSELNVGYATAAHEISIAHKLAPSDDEVTAAYIALLPSTEHLAALQALLATKPGLTPAKIERLNTEVATLAQNKSCTLIESGGGSQQIELLPVLFNGKYARSWGLKAKLNNTSSPLLELDTSVSGIVLNTTDAEKAGVRPLLSAPSTAGAAYTGFVDHVHLGGLDYRDCPVRVVPNSALAGSNSLIGSDFFRDHLIHIDYVSSTLTLNPLPLRPGVAANGLSDRYISPEESNWSPVYISGPAVLLPTSINNKGPFLFVMDTGNYRSVISPPVTASLLTAQQDATLNLQGTSGTIVKVLRREGGGDTARTSVYGSDGKLIPVSRPFKIPVYHFTNNEYPDTYSVSFDLSPTSHAAGTEVSGLLGFGVLRSYYLDINYRDGLARILFDQNRTYQTRQVEGFH